MRMRGVPSPVGVLLLALLSLSACGGSPPAPNGPVPMESAVRGDDPYIRGAITERSVLGDGTLRIRVEVRPGVEARTPAALVTILPEAVIRWSNGDHATSAELQVGREVTVWVMGPELRSMPPQVSARGLVLHPSSQ